MSLFFAKRLSGMLGLIALSVLPLMVEAETPKSSAPESAMKVQSSLNGFVVRVNGEVIQVTACRDDVFHIVAAPGDTAVQGASPAQPWMLSNSTVCPGAKVDFVQGADSVTLSTKKLRVKFEGKGDKENGDNLVYSTIDGTELLRESPAVPRTYEPVDLDGAKAFTVEDRYAGDDGGTIWAGAAPEWDV